MPKIQPVSSRNVGDTEDFDTNEEIVEGRRHGRPFWFLSFLRHILACSGVVFLPFCGAIIDATVADDIINFDYVLHYFYGEIIGILSGGIYLFFFGRKPAIVVSNLLYLVSIFVSDFRVRKKGDKEANPNVLHSILGATLNKFTMMLFLFYTAENCSVTFRGFFLGLYYSSYYLANHLAMLSGVLDLNPVYLVCIMVTLFSLVMSFFAVETPYFLATKGKLEKAEETFSWIRTGRVNTVEYDRMLDQAQKKITVKDICSPTFVICMIMCVLLELCNFNGFELLQEVYYHKMSLTEADWAKFEYKNIYLLDWMLFTANMCQASFFFACVSFVIRRKIVYGIGFALTLLTLVPVFLAHSPYNMMLTLSPISFMITAATRDPLTMILPFEILPPVMRNVGLMAIFTLDKLIYFFLYAFVYKKDTRARKVAYIFRRTGKKWIIFSYSLSLIGIPFLLIFMPETKNRSIFEEVTIFSSRKKGVQNAEESATE